MGIQLQFDSCVVTGGAGFIGSHICEQALSQGVDVLCIDNLVSGYKANVEHLMSHPRFKFVKADIQDAAAMDQLLKGRDVVFNNAASKNSVCRVVPEVDLRVNAEGTRIVAESCIRNGVRKLVHASTGSVYGESGLAGQSESDRLAPISFYGTSKAAGEHYLNALATYYPGFRFSVIRYFHVFGTRQDPSPEAGYVIPTFATRAWKGLPLQVHGDGQQVRSFTHVLDDVEANFLAANSSEADGCTFNAASGIQVTIADLARRIVQLTQSSSEIEFTAPRVGDIKYFRPVVDSLVELGAPAPRNFDNALLETVMWYRDA